MNFQESLDYLYARGHELETMNLGLARMQALTAAAGHPERTYPAVLIAGTNGKGSTAAMTFAIARAAGLRAGLYTSPDLVKITERIRITDRHITRDITEEEFALHATQVRALGERLIAAGKLSSVPSLFEQVTMIAYLFFAFQQIELAVLEVGLGGRLDATNVCEPLVTAITPIDLDHQRHLGNTLAAIAGEKAGIIRPGVPVVVAPQHPEAEAVIRARANVVLAPLISVDEEIQAATVFGYTASHDVTRLPELGLHRLRYDHSGGAYDVQLGLRGQYQVTNALTVIHVAETLCARKLPITHAAIEQGLRECRWPGRLELMQWPTGRVPLLLDGAHNPAGARVLRDFLTEFCTRLPLTMIFGAMSDKPFGEMEEILLPVAEQVIVAHVNHPRATQAAELVASAARYGINALPADSVANAIELAQQITPHNGLICVCGSLYLVGEVKQLIENARITKA
jgi:dihydrofolate synthase/folylpolyglutamate synthase